MHRRNVAFWLCSLLLIGCADVRMTNAIQAKQYKHIVIVVEEQARERPPVSEREAVRLTEIRRVATQGLRIAEIEIKHKGAPDKAIPSATDYEAVHHETCVYEEDVEAELAMRKVFDPFIKKAKSLLPFAGNAVGGGGLLAMVLGLLKGRGKLKRCVAKKSLALGQMFTVAAEHVEKDKLSKALNGTEAQAEYRERRNGNAPA